MLQLLDLVGFPCDRLRSCPSLEDHPPGQQHVLWSSPALSLAGIKPLALDSLGAETVSGFQQLGRVRTM